MRPTNWNRPTRLRLRWVLYPTLASLEMLLYPKSALVIANEVLAAVGIIEVIAPEAPLALLVWGAKRTLPVRVNQFQHH